MVGPYLENDKDHIPTKSSTEMDNHRKKGQSVVPILHTVIAELYDVGLTLGEAQVMAVLLVA